MPLSSAFILRYRFSQDFSSPTHHFPSFTLFGSSVTLSSRHPSRATWTCRLGCLGRMCSLPPLPSYPMSSICNPSSIKHQAVLTLSARHPSQATLACRLGCLGGVALVIRLSSVLDFTKACLASFFRRRGFLCICLGEHHFSFIFRSI